MWRSHEPRSEGTSKLRRLRGAAMLSALFLGVASLATSSPAWAIFDGGGGNDTNMIGTRITTIFIRCNAAISSAIRARPAAARPRSR